MFTWSFASHKEHSPSWYIAASIVVLTLVIFGIVMQLFFMSVASFLFVGVYLLIENNSTPTTQVEVLEQGIQVGGSFYDYTAFSRFAMVTIADVPTFIRLYPNRKLAPLIDIPLSRDINNSELREYLSRFMLEDHNNSISSADALIHAMKL